MPAKKKLETKKKISVSLSEDSIKRGEIVAQKKGFPSFSSYLDQLLRADITEDPIHVTLYTSEGTKYTQVKTLSFKSQQKPSLLVISNTI